MRAVALLVALALGAGCSDSATTPVTPTEAAGVYTLASVSGRGPETGTFILGADRTARRSVKYSTPAGTVETVLTGNYTLNDEGIFFALSESAISSYVWPVQGEWRGSGFSISYPDPADGPNIVETYRRLP